MTKHLLVCVLIIGLIIVAYCQFASNTASTVLNVTNSTSGSTTPGTGNPGGTVVQPPPLPPSPTPTTCYKHVYSDSFHSVVYDISSKSESYQLSVAATLCNQKGWSDVLAVLAFKGTTPAQDDLYYSCFKQVTTTC